MSKKLIALAIVMMMVLALFAGCAVSDGKVDNTTSPQNTSEPEDSAAPEDSTEPEESEEAEDISDLTMSDDKPTITHWTGYTGADRPIFESVAEKFNTGDSGYQLQISMMAWDILDQKLTAGFATGDGPDFFVYGPQIFAKYYDMGALVDISSAFEDGTLDKTIYPTSVYETGIYNGEVIAAPMCVFNSLLYYNKDMLNEAGYDAPPETLDELLECAVACTKMADDGSVAQYGMSIGYAWLFDAMYWGEGLEVVDMDNFKAVGVFDSDAAIAFVEKIADYMINKKIGYPLADDDGTYFSSGKLAMTFGGPWMTTQYSEAGINYDICDTPAGSVTKKIAGLVNYFIPTIWCEDIDGFYAWQNHWATPESQFTWASGSGYPSFRLDQADDPELAEYWCSRFSKSADLFTVRNYVKLTTANNIFDDVCKNTWQGICLGTYTDIPAQMHAAAQEIQNYVDQGKVSY